MSLPTAAFLDTSVFTGQQYNFASTAFETFLPVARARGLKLLLPDPTEREIRRQIAERSDQALKALEDARRQAPFLVKWAHFPKRVATADWEVRRVASSELKSFLSQLEVVRLDYKNVDVREVMRWYDEATPPFGQGKKRKEFPDAFAVAILAAYARQHDVVVAVVSADDDFKKACERYPSLLHFKALPVLTEIMLSETGRIVDLRNAVMKDTSALEALILSEAKGWMFSHASPGYEILESRVLEARVVDVRIVALGANECKLAFEVDVDSEHLLHWEEVEHDDSNTIEEQKWILETTRAGGTAKVALRPDTNAISEVLLLTTDIDFVDVTETPRHRW